MICELSRFTAAAESCDRDATHSVTTTLPGDQDPRDVFVLCSTDAGRAFRKQTARVAGAGEVVAVIPGLTE